MIWLLAALALGAETQWAEALVLPRDLVLPSPTEPLSKRAMRKCAAGEVPEGSLALVVVTPAAIEFAGMRTPLTDGRVPADDLDGPRIRSLWTVLEAITDKLDEAAELGCTYPVQATRGRRVLIAVDGRVPFTTPRAVMYTLGQAGFGEILLRVDAPATAHPTPNDARDGRQLSVALDGRGYTLLGTDDASSIGCSGDCSDGPEPEALRSAVVTNAASWGILAPHPETPWSIVLDALLAMSSTADGQPLLRRTVIAGGISGAPDPDHAPTWRGSGGLPTPVLPADGAPVLYAPLPAIGEPTDAPDGRNVILGALDRGLIDEAIMERVQHLRYCYQRRLTEVPGLEGKLVMRFIIEPDGSTSSVSATDNTLDEAVGTCIAGVFERMTFPEPTGGGIVKVSYPLVFAP